MSSYIVCKLEVKNIDMIKKILTSLDISYIEGENLQALGYGNIRKDVDLLVKKRELKKINPNTYGDMGFKYNKETKSYDMIIDHLDKKIINTVQQLYAVETIKDFAVANRKNYTVVSGIEDLGNKEIVLDIFV